MSDGRPSILSNPIRSDPTLSDANDIVVKFDCSTYLTIVNNTDKALDWAGTEINDGKQLHPAPQTIFPKHSGNFVVNDKWGFYGSRGKVTYNVNGGQIGIYFHCPPVSNNQIKWSGGAEGIKLNEPSFNLTGSPLTAVVTVSAQTLAILQKDVSRDAAEGSRDQEPEVQHE
ncbi:hypothetical protein FRB94_011287 [Tulasnella sp. JGI-2019a]|nr:hypothetical protein FRB93_006345 [Tulasnella sp. JGI-2019a]KAG8992792.1 hypothetical protein FRB94_011287 [Tulasnella sp. JGI-2019a]KAG9025525.1 hypothetical protein FRB95_010074 [Tulasnella sp. JGI-2019a]